MTNPRETKRKRCQSKRGEPSQPDPPSTQEKTSNPPPPPQPDHNCPLRGETETLSSPPQTQRETQLTIDSDLLDCPLCFEPFSSEIYQCMNGHVVCSSCNSELDKSKCPVCASVLGFRCIALEKIVESAHLPCTYASFGCCQSVPYSQKELHMNACIFGPSPCPIPSCDHKAFSGEWRGHFMECHNFPRTCFSYGRYFSMIFEQGDPFFILSGPVPDEDMFLLVNESVPYRGIHALSLYSIDQHHPDQDIYFYKLVLGTNAGTKISALQWESKVRSIKEWKKGELDGHVLLVPSGISMSGQIKVHIVIKKM